MATTRQAVSRSSLLVALRALCLDETTMKRQSTSVAKLEIGDRGCVIDQAVIDHNDDPYIFLIVFKHETHNEETNLQELDLAQIRSLTFCDDMGARETERSRGGCEIEDREGGP